MSADEISAPGPCKHQTQKNKPAPFSFWTFNYSAFVRGECMLVRCWAVLFCVQCNQNSNRDRWTTINGTITLYISVPNTFIILLQAKHRINWPHLLYSQIVPEPRSSDQAHWIFMCVYGFFCYTFFFTLSLSALCESRKQKLINGIHQIYTPPIVFTFHMTQHRNTNTRSNSCTPKNENFVDFHHKTGKALASLCKKK